MGGPGNDGVGAMAGWYGGVARSVMLMGLTTLPVVVDMLEYESAQCPSERWCGPGRESLGQVARNAESYWRRRLVGAFWIPRRPTITNIQDTAKRSR